MSGAISEITDDGFADAIRDGVVAADFYGTFCPPCKFLDPVIAQLAARYAGRARFVRINVDDHAGAALDHAVDAIPTVILFKDGEERCRLFGAQKETTIAGELDKLL